MLTYTLKKTPGHPLYEQLYQSIRDDIAAGRLPAGSRLPSKRVLAAHLGEPDPLPEESFAVTVGEDGRIRCGCGWTGTTAEDADEWREHLADAILEALGRVE